MKTNAIIVAAITGMAAISFSSCQTKEQKLENAQEKVVEANEDLREAQREFREESENRLRENDMSFETYRSDIKNEKEEQRVMYERRIDSLEQRNKDLRVRLNQDYDNNDNWETFKREFNHDMEEIKNSLKDIRKNNVK
ncbi:MAG: hypothetical protein K0S44_2807 [Bacteroidetes bacterium]|jgi:predicted signal transduction protein with EAL and GGDEF domain|nr:hypothetical protein [Bacteroidota bacterium]